MKHARIDTPDGPRIVRADGTTPRPRDTPGPVLHLLPELLLGAAALDACRSPRVSCALSVVAPSGLAVPAALLVRQPFPNRRYLVAGTADSRYGLLVPLPSALPEVVVVRFSWRFADPRQAVRVQGQGGEDAGAVDHVLRLRLCPTGRGQVFSMDVSAWPDRGDHDAPACDRQPYAVLSVRGLPDERWARGTVEWDAAGGHLGIDERLDVPGILLSDVHGFEEFAEEQLHEVEQTAAFDPASPTSCAHRANASIEMPPAVLAEAVTLARGVPFGEGTAYSGSMAVSERHPALRTLCGWWNAHAPDPACRRASLCDVEVRVREDGQYHAAYYEVPSSPVTAWDDAPEARARVGDVALVTFLLGQRGATFDEDGCHLRDVAGHGWQTVGVSEDEVRSGECDEGWYTLRGLAAFPERFPAAWAYLTTASGQDAMRGHREPRLAPLRSKFLHLLWCPEPRCSDGGDG